MEYDVMQILYDEFNKIRKEINHENKSYRAVTNQLGIKLYHSKLDDNVLAYYTKKNDDYNIVVNDNIDKYYELVSVYTLISIIILYKKLKEDDLLNIKLYKNGNKIKYSKIIKLFIMDIIFNQNNMEKCLKESEKVNVSKK